MVGRENPQLGWGFQWGIMLFHHKKTKAGLDAGGDPAQGRGIAPLEMACDIF